MNRQKIRKAHKVFLSLFMCIVSMAAFAQRRQMTGTITDGTGEPMIGVNVLVKGTTNGTITDIDGMYSIPNVGNNEVFAHSII